MISADTLRSRVLLIEDEEESKDLIAATLKSVSGSTKLKWVKSAEEAKALLNRGDRFNLIIADHFLDGHETGVEFWKGFHKKNHQTPFIITSSLAVEEFDRMVQPEKKQPIFLQKPFHMEDCRNLVDWCLEESFNISRDKIAKKQSQWAEPPIFTAVVFLTILAFLMSVSPTPTSKSEMTFNMPPFKIIEPKFQNQPQPQNQPFLMQKVRGELKDQGIEDEIEGLNEVIFNLGNIEKKHQEQINLEEKYERYKKLFRIA